MCPGGISEAYKGSNNIGLYLPNQEEARGPTGQAWSELDSLPCPSFLQEPPLC